MIAKGRLREAGMNRLERAWADQLQLRFLAKEIAWYRYEGITLKLAPDTRYTPDFAVMLAGGELELHEVKGHMRDDAAVKLKVAAEQFPFRVLLIQRHGKAWGVREI